jgi:hypothetical protein
MRFVIAVLPVCGLRGWTGAFAGRMRRLAFAAHSALAGAHKMAAKIVTAVLLVLELVFWVIGMAGTGKCASAAGQPGASS